MSNILDKKKLFKIRCDISDERLETFGIYKIRNLINDKCYIGQCYRPFIVRWLEHQGDLFKNKNTRYLQNAFNKYGYENFIFEIIECVPQHIHFYLINKSEESEEHLLEALTLLNDKEEYYINYYIKQYGKDSVYNLRLGGLNSSHSDETKELMSKVAKIRCENEDERKRLANIAKIIHKEDGERKKIWKQHHDDYWQKQESHEKATQALLKRYEDPEEHIKTSKGLLKFWQNAPEEKHKELSISTKNSWTDERKAKHSIEVKSRYENEEYYNNFCDKLRLTTQSQEYKDMMSIIQNESYAKHPERKEKQSKSQKIAQNRPETKKKKSNISKGLWKNPEYVNKVVSKTNETKQRNKEAWMKASEHILYFLFEDNPKLRKLGPLSRKHLIMAICAELDKLNLSQTYKQNNE